MFEDLSEEQISEVASKAFRSTANPHLEDHVRLSAIHLLSVIYSHTTILKSDDSSVVMATPIYDTLRLMKFKWGIDQALKDAALFLGDSNTEIEFFLKSDEFFPPIDIRTGM